MTDPIRERSHTLTRAEATLADLRAATRDAHAAIKDLKAAEAALEAMLKRVREAVDARAEQQIRDEITDQIRRTPDLLQGTIDRWVDTKGRFLVEAAAKKHEQELLEAISMEVVNDLRTKLVDLVATGLDENPLDPKTAFKAVQKRRRRH